MGFIDVVKRVFSPNDLKKHTSTQQLARIKQDVSSWRHAVKEAEAEYLPYRVKMQQLFQDTVLNGHIASAIEKRKDLTLLKDYCFLSSSDAEIDSLKNLCQEKWLRDIIGYILDAKLFGYTLINWTGVEGDKLTGLQLIKRHLISPDRRMLSRYDYVYTGKSLDDEDIQDWSLYVDTPNITGSSTCGFGLLYPASYYEIFLRNLTGFNGDYVELFAQPFRHAKTNKTEEDERADLEDTLRRMGSSGYAITDPTDEIIFLDAGKGGSQGWQSYGDFEKRLEAKISKLFLGHADAIDSVTGKLGNTGTDDDSVGKAIRNVQSADNTFVEDVINEKLLPKLRNLGFKIPLDAKFKFKNDEEVQKERDKKNDSNKKFVDNVKTLFDAGFVVDPKQIEEETGLKVTVKVEEPDPGPAIPPKIKNQLNSLYKNAK